MKEGPGGGPGPSRKGYISHAGKFSAALLKTSTSRSPAFASSMIFLAITSSVRSAGRLIAARTVSNAMPISRVVSGSKFWSPKKGLMGTRAPTQRKLPQSLAPLAILTLSAVKSKSELNRHYLGVDVLVFRKQHAAQGDACPAGSTYAEEMSGGRDCKKRALFYSAAVVKTLSNQRASRFRTIQVCPKD